MRIREIAQTRVRYGYRMIRVLLNREGWKVGKDLVYRLYREEGLGLRKRPAGKRRAAVHRDIFTRESLAIEVGQSLKGGDVVRVLNQLKQQRGAPKVIFCDNGAEFTVQMICGHTRMR